MVESIAVADILDERDRRMSEADGWLIADDNAQTAGQLIRAAISYCGNAGAAAQLIAATNCTLDALNYEALSIKPPSYWPWHRRWWKPSSPRADLVRAAALIIAEIERLDREGARHG